RADQKSHTTGEQNVAVKLRLMRVGKTKQPTYRVVAADARSPRDGRFIEIVGTYQPRHEPSTILIDDDKALKWLREGAQPTETVEKLLKINGTWEQFKPGTSDIPRTKPLPKKTAPVADAPIEAAAPAATDAPAAEAAPEPAAPETPEAEPGAAPVEAAAPAEAGESE
ncbi:MAG TPA: 30S ribosomal protein S16, partial [Acidimicrobiales bacterium]|nr:30S ribosomal protein S16 [Acidimicrobiales bacterium]